MRGRLLVVLGAAVPAVAGCGVSGIAVHLARRTGKCVRGHTLVWDQQLSSGRSAARCGQARPKLALGAVREALRGA